MVVTDPNASLLLTPSERGNPVLSNQKLTANVDIKQGWTFRRFTSKNNVEASRERLSGPFISDNGVA